MGIKTDNPRCDYIDKSLRIVLQSRTPVTVEQIASKLGLTDLQRVLVRRWLNRYAEQGLVLPIPQGRSEFQAWLATEHYSTMEEAVAAASVWCAFIFLRKHKPDINIEDVPAFINQAKVGSNQEITA